MPKSCAWGEVAPRLKLDGPGCRCDNPPSAGVPWCEEHTNRIALAFVRQPEHSYMIPFATGVVTALGTLVVTHASAIYDAIRMLATVCFFNPTEDVPPFSRTHGELVGRRIGAGHSVDLAIFNVDPQPDDPTG